jgi:RNA polymerase sigma factor (sigma-70 family)
MNAEPLDRLLDRIRTGDPLAAEQLVSACEPGLLRAIHRSFPDRIRSRFDSVDVVQSVWAHVLPGLRAGVWDFPGQAQFHAFLFKVARRRLISRVRRHLASAEREQAAGMNLDALPAARQPRPSEVVQASELWETMLALSPPEHHQLLLLRRQGLALEEIARRTGMHEGSVRRILRQLARRLALEQEPVSP